MLQQICEYIHNYFIKDAVYGAYTISNGTISPIPSLKNGQRFLIRGSDLNDGVYTYNHGGITNDDESKTAELKDEAFEGYICPMSIPREVDTLAQEIAAWQDKYGDKIESPYESESVIGVYSYTKKSGSDANGSGEVGWQTIYSKRLNAWRKACL